MSDILKRENDCCDIVSDLLPLYHDGVVSDGTKGFVEEHLRSCEKCRAELEVFSEALPVPTCKNPSTKNTFVKAVRSRTAKRVAACAAIIISLVILGFGVYRYLEITPLRALPAGEVQVHKVYRYEIEGERKFFVLYSNRSYSHGTVPDTKNEGGRITFSVKTSPFSRVVGDRLIEKEAFVIEDLGDCEKLYLGEELIWSETENGNESAPDYVYEYEEYCEAPAEWGSGWAISFENDYAFRQYPGTGRLVIWNIDGERLYDGYADESGCYPDISDRVPLFLRNMFN